MGEKEYITARLLKIGAAVVLGGGFLLGSLPGGTRLYGNMITSETVIPFIVGGLFLVSFAKAGHRIGYIPRGWLNRERDALETAIDDQDHRVVAYGGFTLGIVVLMLSMAHCVAVIFAPVGSS